MHKHLNEALSRLIVLQKKKVSRKKNKLSRTIEFKDEQKTICEHSVRTTETLTLQGAVEEALKAKKAYFKRKEYETALVRWKIRNRKDLKADMILKNVETPSITVSYNPLKK